VYVKLRAAGVAESAGSVCARPSGPAATAAAIATARHRRPTPFRLAAGNFECPVSSRIKLAL
jgi:hypothetical protein